MNATLEQIETKIAFLERANTELSDVVYRQEREIEALKLQLAAMLTRIETSQGADPTWTAEEERPPHY